MLATTEDLGRITDVCDPVRAQTLLAQASAAVVSYTGQQFVQATTTDRVRVRRGYARLPQRPVSAVTAVADMNANPITFEWYLGDKVKVASNVFSDFAFEPWTNPINVVDVTYTHGYAVVPTEIVAVVCQAAGRALGTSPQDASLSQETLGSYNYSVGAASASGALGFLAGERAILDRYTRTAGTVSVDR